MKNTLKILSLLVAIFVLVLATIAVPTNKSRAAVAGFHISGRNLVDANGNNFVMRGINHAHAWFPEQTSAFANIKATGANAVRVVIQGGGRWGTNSNADVANVISLCKTNKLVCVLEDHDTTGYGEDATAVSMATAVNYWKQLQPVLTGEEAYVIINIGNESYGNINAANWVTDTKNAITSLRAAGFKHTLMVSAPNWGQDWSGTMKNNATSIFNHDPDKNVLFDVHMYGVYGNYSAVQTYISSYVSANLPLVIGEFGQNHSDGNVDEDSVMSEAQAKGIGYIGWSWSGNSGGVEYLDLVTAFNPAQRSAWGNRLITGVNGISTTSQEASIYAPATKTPTSQPAKAVPGTIQAEDYDNGGEGVAYHDTDATNVKGQYRTDAVDIEVSTDTGGGYNIADIQPTEWLRYTVNVAATGSYDLGVRVASATAGGSLHVEVDGVNVTGTMTVPVTGGWQTWSTVTKTGINLTAGQHTVKLVFDSTGFNVNWIKFTTLTATNTPLPRTSTPTATKTNTPVGPTTTPVPATRTPTAAPATNTPASGTLKVQYKVGDTSATDNQIKPYLKIVNTGSSAVNLSTLKIRYWFTRETAQNQSTFCDWAVIACSSITSSAVQSSGNLYYLEVSFTSGTLNANSNTGEIQMRTANADWSNYNEVGDYSYDATKTAYADWSKVTLYQNGVLVWGTQP